MSGTVVWDDIHTPEQLVAAMRERKRASGLTYAELQQRADAVGDELPPVVELFDACDPPDARALAAFIRACGGDTDEVAAWVAVYRRVTARNATSPVPVAPETESRLPEWLVDLLPPIFRHPRLSVRVAAAGLAGLVAFGLVGLWLVNVPLTERGVDTAAAVTDEPEEDDTAEDAPPASPEAASGGQQQKSTPKQAKSTPTPQATPSTPDGDESEGTNRPRRRPDPYDDYYDYYPYDDYYDEDEYDPYGDDRYDPHKYDQYRRPIDPSSPAPAPYCGDPYSGCVHPGVATD